MKAFMAASSEDQLMAVVHWFDERAPPEMRRQFMAWVVTKAAEELLA